VNYYSLSGIQEFGGQSNHHFGFAVLRFAVDDKGLRVFLENIVDGVSYSGFDAFSA